METNELFSRILVPVDFSPPSLEALQLAVRMASSSGATLTLMHVYEPPSYQLMPDAIFMASPETMARQISQVNEQLEKLRRETEAKGPKTTTVLSEGNAYVEIVKEANAGRHDLVIIGTHGHTALRHLLLGSVAERVVRTANPPVLTVRSPAHRL